MKKEVVATRKLSGEVYEFILEAPSYKGEIGCLGIELQPYIYVKAPKNCFGYNDFIRFKCNKGVISAYGDYRYYPNWILNQLISTYSRLVVKHNIEF